MKKQVSLLLSIFMISEIIFSSAAFAEQDLPVNVAATNTNVSQESDKETKVDQEKSEIKEISAYIFGVAGCAAAIITCAYNMLFKSAPDAQAEAPASPPRKTQPKSGAKKEETDDSSDEAPKKAAARKPAPSKKPPLPEGLKAIHWQDNLCWFNSTILMFYYHKNFHDCITSFPIDEGNKLLSRDIDCAVRSRLEAFIELTKTLRGIDSCDGVYHFPNRKLYNLLDNVFDFHIYEKGRSQKVRYGDNGIPFQSDLYDMIISIFVFADNFLINGKGEFPKINAWLSQLNDDINPHTRKSGKWSLNEMFKRAGIAQRYGSNQHYWVEITRGESRYEIGRSIRDSSAISTVKP